MTADPIYLMVFGSRTLDDYDLVRSTLDRWTAGFRRGLVVCHGEWRAIPRGSPRWLGADLMADYWAEQNGFPRMTFPPPFDQFPGGWTRKHPGAFHARNREMVEFVASQGRRGRAAGFWDGSSPGTASVIELCKRHGVKLRVRRY